MNWRQHHGADHQGKDSPLCHPGGWWSYLCKDQGIFQAGSRTGSGWYGETECRSSWNQLKTRQDVETEIKLKKGCKRHDEWPHNSNPNNLLSQPESNLYPKEPWPKAVRRWWCRPDDGLCLRKLLSLKHLSGQTLTPPLAEGDIKPLCCWILHTCWNIIIHKVPRFAFYTDLKPRRQQHGF